MSAGGNTYRLIIPLLLFAAAAQPVPLQPSDQRGGFTTRAAEASTAPSSHPLVGSWRIEIGSIVATYDFKADNTFTLRFTGVPAQYVAPTPIHEASGTWSIDGGAPAAGKQLLLKNQSSTTALTVTGEDETATIVSVTKDELVLSHTDRKGKQETLKFRRIISISPGLCDSPAIKGAWRSDEGGFEFRDAGVLILDNQSGTPERGQWTQQGNRLHMQRTLRAPQDPWRATAPVEEVVQLEYTFDFSSDKTILILTPRDHPDSPRAYKRSATSLIQDPSRSRPTSRTSR
jgi:hypothetical protein